MKRKIISLCCVSALLYCGIQKAVDAREIAAKVKILEAVTKEGKQLYEKLRALPSDLNKLIADMKIANRMTDANKKSAEFGRILKEATKKLAIITDLAIGHINKNQYGQLERSSDGSLVITGQLAFNALDILPSSPETLKRKASIQEKLTKLLDQLDLAYFLSDQIALALGYKEPEPGKPVEVVPVEIQIPAAAVIDTPTPEDL
jgi:hypothetical protein